MLYAFNFQVYFPESLYSLHDLSPILTNVHMGGMVPVGTICLGGLAYYIPTGWCSPLPRRRYIQDLCIADGWD